MSIKAAPMINHPCASTLVRPLHKPPIKGDQHGGDGSSERWPQKLLAQFFWWVPPFSPHNCVSPYVYVCVCMCARARACVYGVSMEFSIFSHTRKGEKEENACARVGESSKLGPLSRNFRRPNYARENVKRKTPHAFPAAKAYSVPAGQHQRSLTVAALMATATTMAFSFGVFNNLSYFGSLWWAFHEYGFTG